MLSLMRIGSHRVFTTTIRIMQEVTQLTDKQRREIYLSPISIGPAIAVLVEPTAAALHNPAVGRSHSSLTLLSIVHLHIMSPDISHSVYKM